MSNNDEHDNTDGRPHHHGLIGDEEVNVRQVNYISTIITDLIAERCIEVDINFFLALVSVLVANVEAQNRCVTNLVEAVYDNLGRALDSGDAEFQDVKIRKPS